MKNIALILAYDGTNYHGWQLQKNGSSIQGEVEHALCDVTSEHVRLSGVGRTDAGVHAKRYVANFKSTSPIPIDRLVNAMNARLPRDIAVLGAVEVPLAFDARFDCTRKEYTYYIYQSKIKDAFASNRVYHHPYPLDITQMRRAAEYWKGRQDFASVRSTGTPVSSTIRTIYTCEIDEQKDRIAIRVSADGFLYHMVRGIAGTLLYIGEGKLKADQMPALLQAADRAKTGPNLPAWGLYMTRLWYEHTPELTPFGLTD